MILYIVDDEKNVRDSIANYIPWDSIHIENVITARNGLDALDKMARQRPNILLTDVRMPKMNGIELSKIVRETYPDCHIIFLSGYADKDYLLSAIELNAVKYIEKPLDKDDILQSVNEAVKRIHVESDQKQQLDELKNLQQTHLLHDREVLLQKLISTDDYTEEAFSQSISRMPCLVNRYAFTFCLVHIYWPNTIEFTAQNQIKEDLMSHFLHTIDERNYLVSFNHESHLLMLYTGAVYTSSEKTLLTSLQDHLLEEFELSSSIGISNTFKHLEGSSKAYKEAGIAADQQFFLGKGHHILYSEVSAYKASASKSDITLLEKSLLENETLDASRFIRRLRQEQMQNRMDIPSLKASYLDCLLLVSSICKSKGFQCYQNTKTLQESVADTDELNQLHQMLTTHVAQYFEASNALIKEGGRIFDIRTYISEHLDDNQLSVNTIATNFELSSNYLSTYFKKQTGKTINQFITIERIEKAKKLLLSTNKKVSEISLDIGLNDTNYFSVLFKKHVGLTPLEFKSQH